MTLNPYKLYRAFKAGRKLYIVWRPREFRITLGSSLQQVLKRFTGWNARPLMREKEQIRVTR